MSGFSLTGLASWIGGLGETPARRPGAGPFACTAVLDGIDATFRTGYLPLLRAHHVRMTLGGHEHLLEHWVERYQDGGQRYRMDHLITGGGGAPTYAYASEPWYLAVHAAQQVSLEHLERPGSRRADNPHHTVVVTVDGERLSGGGPDPFFAVWRRTGRSGRPEPPRHGGG